MNISEDQKRWLVIGVAFNKLVSQIRPSLEQSLQTEYQSLRSSHNIHVQTPPGPILKNHPKHLKYENINSNINHKLPSGKFDFSKFDYKVTNHVDFAKLYVQPFMAKFSTFDGKCDGSAVLLLLAEVPVFSLAIQSSAKTVREHVRNEWAHCNFTDWDALKFQSSFQEMQQLVKSIGLPAADENKILSELIDWETKGTTFCGNSPVDPTLLSLVHNEVLQLSTNLDEFVCQYKEQKDLLESQFLEVKQSLEQLLELPQKFEQMEHDMETLKQKVEDLSFSSVKCGKRATLQTSFGALDRNEYFTGRKKELENLEKAFQDLNTMPDGSAAVKRKANVYSICGLGGCGKSSLAFEYAWRNMERYPGGVFVVNGESDDLMRASFQRIHGAFVHITQSNQHREEAKQFDQLLNETLSWLGNLKDKWLLLVDNMDQKELGPCAWTLFRSQWKSNTSVDVVVTSRRSSQVLCDDLDLPSGNCFELDPFSVDESVEFLKKRTGLPFSCKDQDEGEGDLAQELGGLPLALEQAAAYIKTLKCPIQLYLQQYRAQKSILLNTKTAKPLAEIYNKARLAVQTTWILNFRYIENGEKDQELGMAAAFFMKIAAYLSPDEIPIEVLNVGAPEVDHEDLKKRLEMPIGTNQIIDLMVNFSLFKRKSDDTLSIHRLVQETLRDRCYSEGETDKVLSSAIRMMHQAFLDCLGGTDFFRDVYERLASQIWKEESRVGRMAQLYFACEDAPLIDWIRWQKLCANAFHLGDNLLNLLSDPSLLFSEESARLFCEAAFHCYSLGDEIVGYRSQQLVLDIICAIKEPLRYYKGDDLLKITRILRPFEDSALLLRKLNEFRKKEQNGTGVAVATNDTDELLETINLMEPKAREAFSRGDYQTSVHLYTDIVTISNFNASCRGTCKSKQPYLVPLGEILCCRGVAHLRMEHFETAVDDFNASTCVDIQCYRGYYWKAYALCKLVENGRTEFTSRAQAAAAVLHYKFAHCKPNDIQKLQKKFPGLLNRIEYKFVSQVSELKELERLSEVRNDRSSLTIILADGDYFLEKMVILGGQYYFVCLPGGCACLHFIKGLRLSQGSFLFENVTFFGNDVSLFSAFVSCTTLGKDFFAMLSEKVMENPHCIVDLDTITLGRAHRTETGLASGTDRKVSALIEANDVHSLVINHCSIEGATSSGIEVNFSKFSREKNVSVRSSSIMCCSGAGLLIHGDTQFCHVSINDNELSVNLYGVFIDSPSRFYLEKNNISGNNLSGIVAVRASEGKILRNSLNDNGKHGILFNKTNAIMEENVISHNRGWGIVCCCESNLHCKENVLERNFCGGLRIFFNGKRSIVVQSCAFRENSGPVVFPSTPNELCRIDLKWKPLLLDYFVIGAFIEGTISNFASGEFTSPLLRDNRVSESSDTKFHTQAEFCFTCFKSVKLDSDVIECPSCLVARYCSLQCSYAAKAIHNPVCKCILEVNKECVEYDVFPLTNASPPAQDNSDGNRVGLSLCAIATVSCAPLFPKLKEDIPGFDHLAGVDSSTTFHLCLLTCPPQNLCTWFNSPDIHHFISRYGRHLPDRMLDIKAACIFANFDSESRITTVYKHRIFPLDKVPDGLKWVDRALDVLEKHTSVSNLR